MGSYIVRVKILPTGPEISSDTLLASVKGGLGGDASVRNSKVEPIAYGLYQLVVDIMAPEGDGVVDAIEQKITAAPNVSGYEVMGVSRMSSTVKTG